jgi:hypothetical protein
MEDNLLCRMICNPTRINKNSIKNQNYDSELLYLLKRKYPKYIINLNDLNNIYEKIEEIHRKNLIKELVDNAINDAINGCLSRNI